MEFYELSPSALPQDAQYFFNVIIFCIALSQSSLLLDEQIDNYWDLSGLTKSRPYVFFFWKTDGDETREEKLEIYTDTVIEVRPREISWYATKNTKVIDPSEQ